MKSSTATMNSTILSAAASAASANSTTNSQFRHTIMWNGIISHMKCKLTEMSSSTVGGGISSRLRKQHSRFVSGGIMLIRPNQNEIDANGNDVYFTGAQCVDIVYQYLTANRAVLNFERQVTRDKCVKLCQLIMDSGVFEPAHRTCIKFEDSSLKVFRLIENIVNKPEMATTVSASTSQSSYTISAMSTDLKSIPNSNSIVKIVEKVELCDDDDNYNKKSTGNDKENIPRSSKTLAININPDTDRNNNNQQGTQKQKLAAENGLATPQRQSVNGLIFSKSGFLNKTSNVNTKLKRKLISMKRSSTVHSLLPNSDEIVSLASTKESPIDNSKSSPSSPINKINLESIAPKKESSDRELTLANQSEDIQKLPEKEIKGLNRFTRPQASKLARTKSIDQNDLKLNKNSNKLAQELLMTRQITRELIIEKLLSLIDLPIIEHLLMIDEKHDVEYCEALQRFETVVLNPSSHKSSHTNFSSASNDLIKANLWSKSSINYVQRSLAILGHTYDLAKVDSKEEWRKSALECLEFLDWEKFWQPDEHHLEVFKNEHDKNSKCVLIKDNELYGILCELYSHRQKANLYFMDDSFQPLFSNILVFIKKNHYSKALEILNLGTLLLLKQTQAELKRLLKFLYLTAYSTHSPRLSDSKPNNSIILNHFASNLLNPKVISFEELRLLLNFMLNNFDNLFKLNKSIEESIRKRKLLMLRYGQEEALLEKLYCKQLSSEQFDETSKEETTKALVELINHIIDDPQITLKQKKLKLKALQRIHPEIYEQHFSGYF